MGRKEFCVWIEWKGSHRTYANTAEVSIMGPGGELNTRGHAVDSAARTICIAALRALGIDPEGPNG